MAIGFAKAHPPPRHPRRHRLDRPGRAEHGHRRRAGHGEPAAACCCCPATPTPPATRARCCSSCSTRSRPTPPSTTRSARCRRFFDRITRPEQLLTALPQAMRVLTDPVDTGAVVLSLPQDVQSHAYDFPAEFFAERDWVIRRPLPDPDEVDGGRRGCSRAAEQAADHRRRRRHLLRRHRRAGGAGRRGRASRSLETFAGKGAVQQRRVVAARRHRPGGQPRPPTPWPARPTWCSPSAPG